MIFHLDASRKNLQHPFSDVTSQNGRDQDTGSLTFHVNSERKGPVKLGRDLCVCEQSQQREHFTRKSLLPLTAPDSLHDVARYRFLICLA